MTDFLDEKRKEIESRLRELKPLVDEYNRLEQASQALQGVGTTTTTRRRPGRRTTTGRPRRGGPPRRRQPGRRTTTGRRRRGRPRGSGTRAIQALELVKAKPGITIRELADSMSIK